MPAVRYLESLNAEQRSAVEHGVCGEGSNIAEPLLVIATSLFFGALRSGGNLMQRAVGTPVAIVIVIQGLSIFLLTLGLVLHQWEPARRFLRGGGPRPRPAPAVERTNVELS